MKPFQKALLTGLAAFAATASVSNAQDALGTINKVQVTATRETAADQTTVTGPSGASTERSLPVLKRITVKSILEALRDTPGTGFPVDSGITGWTLVEPFTQGDADVPGVSQGIFAYKKGFTPILLTDAILSIVVADYADSSETFSTSIARDGNTVTKNDHVFKGLSTGTLINDMTFNGFTISRTGIRLIGPRNLTDVTSPSTAPLSTHTITSRTTSISGAEGGDSAYAVYGTIISNGAANLTNIQPFIDASGVTPPAE